MDRQTPRISVVIPTFNSSRALAAAIASVLAQDVDDLELLVVGDGCSDDSEEVVAAAGDPRVSWTNLARNSGGPSRPRNEALRRARGRYIAYLGHDDLFFPWHLSCLVTALETGEAGLVSSLGVYLEPRGASTVFGLPPERRTLAPLSPSTWLHRADLGLRWPEQVRWGHEVWVADRLRERGVATQQVAELTAIKFPAPSWRGYDPSSGTPQAEALACMAADPSSYQQQLLLAVAAEVAGSLVLSSKSRHSLLARAIFAWLAVCLRPYRFPLDVLLRRRHRRLSRLASVAARRCSPDQQSRVG